MPHPMRFWTLAVPGVLLLGGAVVAPFAIGTSSTLAAVQEEPNKPPDEDPASPPEFFWQRSDPSLIHDEPMKVVVPKGLPPLTPKVVVPAHNPITKGKYELGRQLYFDPRLSGNGEVSCATCHNPDKGWSDGGKVSTGIHGQTGNRSAPTVFNTAYGKSMFWDGRSPSLEGQAQGPIINPIEMGMPKHENVVRRIREIPGYQKQFANVFGTKPTLDGIAKAIATFERVAALSGNSKFDKYAAGENDALSLSEKRGMVLFGLRLNADDETETGVELQKAKCTLCHVGANFTDEQYHNLGVGWDEKAQKFKDPGRWAPEPIGQKTDASFGAFKTPTVRNAALTAPYMHDGSMATLEEVVEHYNKGGTPNPSLDVDMKPLKLTPQESADLVAFMKALTGEHKSTAELLPKLPPDPDGKIPDPRAALNTPKKKILKAGPHEVPAS